MPLYYITGIAGSGKSTVLAELKRRGYEAYDVDEAGPVVAKWHNNATGYVHPKSSVKTNARTPEFLASHSWKVSRQEVLELVGQARSKNIFLGGAITNENEIQDLFRSVFALTVNDEILKHRLTTRTNNDWGKSPYELQQTLAQSHKLNEAYRQLGYVLIDASRPANAVAKEILSHIHDDS